MKNRTWAMVFVSAIAALLLVWKLLPAGSGQTAGVYQDGRLIRTIYLPHAGQTETFEVPGPAGGNTIEVSAEGVRVSAAGCPDGICVAHGLLKAGGGPIICLPNRLTIEWAQKDAQVDALSGTGGLS